MLLALTNTIHVVTQASLLKLVLSVGSDMSFDIPRASPTWASHNIKMHTSSPFNHYAVMVPTLGDLAGQSLDPPGFLRDLHDRDRSRHPHQLVLEGFPLLLVGHRLGA